MEAALSSCGKSRRRDSGFLPPAARWPGGCRCRHSRATSTGRFSQGRSLPSQNQGLNTRAPSGRCGSRRAQGGAGVSLHAAGTRAGSWV